MMLVQNEMNQSHESRSLDRVAKITIFCLDQGEGLNELARLDTSKLPLIAQPPPPLVPQDATSGTELLDFSFSQKRPELDNYIL